ncbi:M24 family metallopeptidase [Mycolicibacterium sp. Dal123E01]|uniref:M24 family metallopeptidase n=1 Tax=Mycolicibacterium sp. Dal123E01 TaxID=3457578 RepID=UPI00403EBE6E
MSDAGQHQPAVGEWDGVIDRLRAERGGLVGSWMKESGLDHLLLQSHDDIRYATDFRSLLAWETFDHVICVVDADGQFDVYASHINTASTNPDPTLPMMRSLQPIAGWTPLMAEPARTINVVAAGLKDAKSVGYDAIHPELLRGLREALPGTSFRYIGAELFRLRRRKLPEEVTLMELAAHDNLAAVDFAIASAREGLRDRDVLAQALAAQQASRAETITHFTCLVDPVRGGWFAIGAPLRAGQSFFLDQVYNGLGGYGSDITRTAFLGEPPSAVSAAYSTLIDIYQVVRDKARPGVSVATLDELLNDGLRKSSLAPSPYGLGHGIGIRIMEPPSLSGSELLDSEVVLRVGDTIALEPETAIEVGGQTYPLKVEDCHLVTADGLVPLGVPAPERALVVEPVPA